MSKRIMLFVLIVSLSILILAGCSLPVNQTPTLLIASTPTTTRPVNSIPTATSTATATSLPTETPTQTFTPLPPTPTSTALSPTTTSTNTPTSSGSPSSALLYQAAGVKTIVSITFDDGNADQLQAWDVLQKYQMHATFYIITDKIGQPGYLTLEQIQAVQADGNEIGSHTIDHPRLTNVHGDALRHELCDSRSILQQMGLQINSLAYPYGHYDPETEQAAAACGYPNARGASNKVETIPPKDAYALNTMPSIVSYMPVSQIQRYVQRGMVGGGWVILIFHHVCNRCDKWSITQSAFDSFLAWLQAQSSQGVAVMTIDEAMRSNLHLPLRK